MPFRNLHGGDWLRRELFVSSFEASALMSWQMCQSTSCPFAWPGFRAKSVQLISTYVESNGVCLSPQSTNCTACPERCTVHKGYVMGYMRLIHIQICTCTYMDNYGYMIDADPLAANDESPTAWLRMLLTRPRLAANQPCS